MARTGEAFVSGTGAACIVRVDDVTIATDLPETIDVYAHGLDGHLVDITLRGGSGG
ncbi:MAG: hypothetical protein KDB26_08685 [Microthrixaceae bacterium]|nr:hypothetical protein [Microthrixaceae bacterium]